MNGTTEKELQPLPNGWRLVKLGEKGLFRVESGGTPKSGIREYWNGGVSWITLVDLPDSDIITEITSTNRTISETGLKNSAAILLPANSVVVSSRATIGRIGINRIPLATNQGFKNIVIEDTTQAIPEYVALALTELVPAMQTQASGSTYKEIIKSRFSQLQIPLPPLAEQERIVRILDEKLAVIDKAKQAAETQLEATNALPQAYLREQIPSYEDSLPNGWRWLSLGEVCREDKKTVKPNDESRSRFPYLSLEHVESDTGIINISAVLDGYAQETLSNTFAFSSRHVLYGKLRPYLNKVALPEFEGQCTTEIIPLIPEKVTRSYLACVLRRPETVEFAMRRKTGSRMPRTDMRAFMKMPIPLPPLAEQERIVRILNEKLAAIDKAKQASNTRLDTINAMSAAYLRRAFAGEL